MRTSNYNKLFGPVNVNWPRGTQRAIVVTSVSSTLSWERCSLHGEDLDVHVYVRPIASRDARCGSRSAGGT